MSHYGLPRKGMQYMELGDIIVRMDPATKQVVGLTVTDFVARHSSASQQVRLPVAGEFVFTGGEG